VSNLDTRGQEEEIADKTVLFAFGCFTLSPFDETGVLTKILPYLQNANITRKQADSNKRRGLVKFSPFLLYLLLLPIHQCARKVARCLPHH
jgi:hypothetical protein